MKNFTLIILCLVFCHSIMNAQQKETLQLRNCGTDVYNQDLLKSHPSMMGSEYFERSIASNIAAVKAKLNDNPARMVQFTIPVVVHVIHNGEPIGTGANISDARVLSQIQVLNEDFRRMAGTRGFNNNAVGADVEVEFCLATKNPDGCITNGINRIDMSAVSMAWEGTGGTSNTNTILKPATIWDASRYMNIWSMNFSDSTLLGFAQFPGGPANTDGVVSNYMNFGSDDAAGVTINGAYNLGRTMTHEVGHYLGLFHTFQGGCVGNGDFCNDTPKVANPNYGCPIGNVSCSSIDMVENYMDYTDDVCMNVFTLDQKARVIATLTSSANRPNTTTSDVCVAFAPVNNDVSIQINSIGTTNACSGSTTPNVKIQNFGTTTLMSVMLSFNVDGGANTIYNWTGSLTNGQFVDIDMPDVQAPLNRLYVYNLSVEGSSLSTDQRSCNNNDSKEFEGFASYPTATEIRLTIIPDNYGSDIEWTFSNGELVLYSGGPYTDSDTTPINEVFPVFPNNCYTFTITDSFGDGICCTEGTGSYTLQTSDNTIIRSGGQFSEFETTQISTIAFDEDRSFTDGDISLYPNPASNQLKIKLEQPNVLPDSYEIYNILGQAIIDKQISSIADLTVDTSVLSNGMYFIRISKKNDSVTLRFIKK